MTTKNIKKSETVIEAQQRYINEGENSIHQGYRDAIKALIRIGYTESIKNDCYDDALFLTDIMFEHTDKSVCMLSGCGADGFISTLKKRFEEMLQRIKGNSGEIKIILLSESIPSIPDYLKKLKEKFGDTLKVALATTTQKINHFIVCDGRMLRMEELHDPIEKNTPATDIRADVFFNNASASNVAENLFEVFWKKVYTPNS